MEAGNCINLPQDPSIPLMGIHLPKGCSIIPQRCLFNYIHGGFVYNSQKPETTYMSLNLRIDKHWYIYK